MFQRVYLKASNFASKSISSLSSEDRSSNKNLAHRGDYDPMQGTDGNHRHSHSMNLENEPHPGINEGCNRFTTRTDPFVIPVPSKPTNGSTIEHVSDPGTSQVDCNSGQGDDFKRDSSMGQQASQPHSTSIADETIQKDLTISALNTPTVRTEPDHWVQEEEGEIEASKMSAAVEFQRVQVSGDDMLDSTQTLLSALSLRVKWNLMGSVYAGDRKVPSNVAVLERRDVIGARLSGHFLRTCVSLHKFGKYAFYFDVIGALKRSFLVPIDELHVAADALIKALELRQKYMTLALQNFNRTTGSYLGAVNSGSLKTSGAKAEQLQSVNCPSSDYPHDSPKESANPFEVRYWPEPLEVKLKFQKGIMQVLTPTGKSVGNDWKFVLPSVDTYLDDYDTIRTFVANGPLKSFCYGRLTYLSSKFGLHSLLNGSRESMEQKLVSKRDFYNVRKVDTHIHAASCMTQKHLLRFIKKAIHTKGDVLVCEDEKSGKPITLKQLIDQVGISAHDMSIDNLDVHADRNTFHRFDKFNAKYNPIGQSQLREVFLKTDNYIKGTFFAQILKEVFSDLAESKYQNIEPRLSIYGRSIDEWDNLAKWAINCEVYSENVRWLIQIPRLFDVYHAKGSMKYFQDILTNVFLPLFEVTADPKSHPELHAFLQFVTGLDCVDDESKSDKVGFNRTTPTPENYSQSENPDYAYYIFYMYANLTQLNQFRSYRGLNTLALRPHCGEAGHIHHLISGFLLAENINHGLLLRKDPVLQYLYYLAQVGIAMSPLSNNSLFLDYQRNPLNSFLSRGLNVTLSTDDPLQFHFTKEPLIEEYSIATQVWKLTSVDMCELARNSVLMSGFSQSTKSHWLGANYQEEGVLGNDITRSNVPNIRISYRYETLTRELHILLRGLLTRRRSIDQAILPPSKQR
ncbi:AMP deaminase [Clonorchis sinensis]|uniref:AMP deaminase 2 n=1 Tax=Clonorchis sinensis TaxID=79923 RepID=G7YCD9_CLOSI|nr:AMP deaminase [Clonorchis sinensis]